MKNNILRKADRYTARRRAHQARRTLLVALACLVALGTSWALIRPAAAEEGWTCGQEEHVHTDACYTKVALPLQKVPVCAPVTHAHDEGCYDDDGTPVCGYANFVVHEHGASCYDEAGKLVCALPEIMEHKHEDSCYTQHDHGEDCYTRTKGELTCTLEESEAHTHGAECYDAEGNLTCTLAESEGHQHTDTCYEVVNTLTCTQSEEPVLTCDKEEVILHTHTDECYEKDADGNKYLDCDQQVVEKHVHSDSCFQTVDPNEALTCGQEEGETHTHSERCYGTWELSCDTEEHTHSDACKPTSEPDQEPTYYCGQEEHTHSEACYAEDGTTLACQKEEHTHTEDCRTPTESGPAYTCGLAEHTHSVENGCYAEDGTTLTCQQTEHTHSDLCLLAPEDREKVQAVMDQIDALPTAEDYIAALAARKEAGDLTEYENYVNQTTQQLQAAQAAYDALGETLQAYVTDAARLAELADVLPQEVDLDAPIAQGDVEAVLKRLADLEAALKTLVAGYDDCPAFMERMFTAYSACFEEDHLIVSQEDIQQVDQAFDHLEEVLFENFEYFYAWPYDPSTLSPATFSLPAPRSGDAGGTDSGGELVLDKWVEGNQTDGYTLTLTAYATGTTVRKQVTQPMDIVLVLDQSCSMYKPMGYTGEKFTASNTDVSNLTLDLKVLLSDEGKKNASHRGYYIAQSNAKDRLYVVEYNDQDEKWRFYRFYEGDASSSNNDSTQASFNDRLPDPALTLDNDQIPGHQFSFYKTQYATLYDSIVDFINILHRNGAAHRIAIVGFSGHRGLTTNLFVNGSQIRTPTDEQYENALEYVNTEEGYTSILSSLSAYKTQYGFTHASSGLQMAQNVFANSTPPPDPEGAGRGRMVIFYTDGLINGGDNSDCVISNAYNLKNDYNATFYSFGTGNVVNQLYMTYASSNYPDATSLTSYGKKVSEDYLISANSKEEMDGAFQSALKSVQVVTSNTMVELDEYTILQDVISDYFELPEGAKESDIKVYTADYTGRDTEGNRTFDDENKQELQGAQVTIDSSGTDDRQDTIRVTGFNYAKNHVEDRGEVVSEPRGKKLIVQIPIEVRAGFWGGNNVPTNEKGDSFGGTGTAIFNPERDADGTPVENGSADFIQAFPVPEVNVSFEPTIQAVNKVFYYGSDVGLQALVKEHSITVNGVEVLVGNDGTLTPKENWMDDYATLTWVNDTTGTAQKVNTTACKKDYEFGVVLKPKAACTTNPDGPAPIGGEFPLEGKKETAKSFIHILVPVLTFQDSEITEAQRENLNADYYNKNNYVKTTPITWVHMIGDAEIGQNDATDTEPDLHLSYTPDLGYTHHIPVEVTVRRDSATGKDITTVTTFNWNDCSSAVHKEEHDIEEHMGSEQSPEFRIHVLGFRLPDTGGMGTGRYTVGGLLLLMGAGLLLLRGRKRHGKGGFPAP